MTCELNNASTCQSSCELFTNIRSVREILFRNGGVAALLLLASTPRHSWLEARLERPDVVVVCS